MKTISDYGTKFREIIKANAPVAYGGTKLFDGDRDYLMQIPEEFSATLEYFQEMFGERSISFLEIGTASNLTNTMFWNNLNIRDNVIVDNLECPNVDRSLFGNLQFKDGTVFIIGDSTGIKVQSKVKSLGLKYDIIFCDGNHEYDYVKKDFEYYSQFVKPGGFFVFHDIDNWKVPGVKQFVEELQQKQTQFIPTADFRWIGYENTCGIGVYRREI